MTLDAPPPPVSTMRRDLISAYLASGMKVASWTVVLALVYRYDRPDYFAVFVLVRSTIGLLNYTTLGLAPAMIWQLSKLEKQTIPLASVAELTTQSSPVIKYAEPSTPRGRGMIDSAAADVMKTAILLALGLGAVAVILVFAYSKAFAQVHNFAGLLSGRIGSGLCLVVGFGCVCRLFSDSFSAILQSYRRIAADNYALAVCELAWVGGCFYSVFSGQMGAISAGAWFFVASVVLLIFRAALTLQTVGYNYLFSATDRPEYRKALLSFGLLVSAAQLADFLYAPTDFILIKQLMYLRDINIYAPAVQIDAGLLLLVGGLASVILPKSAHAHASKNQALIRQYFVRGTFASIGLLIAAAIVVYLLSPWIFRLWLGEPMLETQAILPLLLIHTVIGGSSAVGRSILLGMGKVKPFTIAVLVAGVSNVILSYIFVRYAGLGLKGIVLGTICAVVGRCAIWQPWYVWKCLRSAE